MVGSPGTRPVLRNVDETEVRAFRSQVQVVDMIGCEDPEEISAQVESLAAIPEDPVCCVECESEGPLVSISTMPTVIVHESRQPVKMDGAGYFVITPLVEGDVINIEHYAYDNKLLRSIEGTNARDLYMALVNNGWVTEMSHAAYLGKELTRAELSLRFGLKYVQDGA